MFHFYLYVSKIIINVIQIISAQYRWAEIGSKQKRWYTIFCNRWLALIGVSTFYSQ